MTITQSQTKALSVILASFVVALALSSWSVSGASVGGGNGPVNSPNSVAVSAMQQLAKGSGVRTVSDEELAEALTEDDINKRGWNDLQGVWGKKRSWNNLNGMWGKRGWNDLSGMWGKRNSPNWNNLNGLWGKRAATGDALYVQGPNWQGRAAYVIDDGSMDEGPMDNGRSNIPVPVWVDH